MPKFDQGRTLLILTFRKGPSQNTSSFSYLRFSSLYCSDCRSVPRCKNCPCQCAACQSVSPSDPLIANKMISPPCRLLHLQHLLPPMLLLLLSAPSCQTLPNFHCNCWIIATTPPHASWPDLSSVAPPFALVSQNITNLPWVSKFLTL